MPPKQSKKRVSVAVDGAPPSNGEHEGLDAAMLLESLHCMVESEI